MKALKVQYHPGGDGDVFQSVQEALDRLGRFTRASATIFDYTGGVAVSDYTDAFNEALEDCLARSIKVLYFPAGSYRFLSQPDPITFGLYIKGDDLSHSFMDFEDPGTALQWNGAGGGGLSDIGLYYDIPTKAISAATKANPCQVTAVGHGYSNGQKVVIRNVGGMVELNDLFYTIANVATDTFTLIGYPSGTPINSSGFTVYTSGGTAQRVGSVMVYVGGGSAGEKPDFWRGDNIVVSGHNSSCHDYSFLVDGANNQGQGGTSLGVRNGSITRLTGFNAITNSFEMRQARGWNVSGCLFNQAQGLVTSALISGPSASFPSAGIVASNFLGANFVCNHATGVEVSSLIDFGTTATTANSSDCRFWGHSVAFQNNGTDCSHAGFVGSIIETTVLVGAATGLTTNTTADIAGVSLQAGTWDVWGNIWFNPAGTTNITVVQGQISTTTGVFETAPNKGAYSKQLFTGGVVPGANTFGFSVGRRRIVLSSTTTVYLQANATFTIAALSAFGYIGAMRVV